jgi:hypothetical protein
MEMRDAIEADAERLASLTDAPRDVMRNLVHDRTVRVVKEDDEIHGFVSYDARQQTVYVTQIEGTQEVYSELLEEPVRFARTEGMAVELLVADADREVQTAARDAGFEQTGGGPNFDGEPTTRYRIENP